MFSFCEVTSDNVEKVICALDSKKTSMSNSIPPKVLKENGTILFKPLADIINNDISSSCFDGGLKLADLTPIHKENETTSKENYRNISLLPVVSKLFEKPYAISNIFLHVEVFNSLSLWVSQRLQCATCPFINA